MLLKTRHIRHDLDLFVLLAMSNHLSALNVTAEGALVVTAPVCLFLFNLFYLPGQVFSEPNEQRHGVIKGAHNAGRKKPRK